DEASQCFRFTRRAGGTSLKTPETRTGVVNRRGAFVKVSYENLDEPGVIVRNPNYEFEAKRRPQGWLMGRFIELNTGASGKSERSLFERSKQIHPLSCC